MGVREDSLRSRSVSEVGSRSTRAAEVRVIWWWALAWGTVLGVASILCARVWFPQSDLLGPMVFRLTCYAAASVGLGSVAYYSVLFALNRSLRELFLASGFAAIAAGSALQAVSNSFIGYHVFNDRILLVSWLFAALGFAGGSLSSSGLRRGSRFRSTMHFIVAGGGIMAYPVLLSAYAFNPALYNRMQEFPHPSMVASFDTVLSLVTAGLLAVVVARSLRYVKQQSQRLESMLSSFFAACALGLVCRGLSGSYADGLWFCSQVLPASGWLALAAGFAAESALTHKESGDRLAELEALHEVSWSLVGAGGGEEFLRAFVDLLRSKLDAEIAAVYLSDSGGKSLELAGASHAVERYPSLGTTYIIASEDRRPGFHTGHTADAFRSREPRVADDVFVDVEFVPWRTIARGDGRAISLPLMDQGNVFGVLNVYFGDRRRLARENIALLSTIAAASGPAIGNIWAERNGRATSPEDLDIAA